MQQFNTILEKEESKIPYNYCKKLKLLNFIFFTFTFKHYRNNNSTSTELQTKILN